jgi:tetratricopeptide (TPR) repeat protein
MSERAGADHRYTAFLSYSHKDAAAAGKLHRKLETYRLPKRLIGTETTRGPVPARLWPIFRDREELPAATDLSETVREALAQSGSLIVLCSLHAAASLWVAEEIKVFRELHPDRPILAAVLNGDPPSCFPEALRAFGQDGTWHEPLATDLRHNRDGPRLGMLKLVAGITGVGLDALVQRDASRRVKRVMALSTVALVAMLVMAGLTVFALEARREAVRQRAEAEGLVEFMLTDLRDKLRGVGSTRIMIDVNRRALEYYGGQRALFGLGPASLERRARILHLIGADEKDRGRLQVALTAFREARRITEELLRRSPDDPQRIFAQSQSEYWIGSVAELLGRHDEALAAYRNYRAQAERMNQLSPNNPRFIGELAYSESNLGSVHLTGLDRAEAARAYFRRSLYWFERAARLEPRNRNWREEVADAHAWIGSTWTEQGRHAEARAERTVEHALKLALLREDPANRAYLYAVVISNRSLARSDMELRDFAGALPRLLKCRDWMNELLIVDPDNLVWRDQATMVEIDHARLFIAIGRHGEARAALEVARRLLAGSLARSPESSAARDQLRARIDEFSVQLRPPRRS